MAGVDLVLQGFRLQTDQGTPAFCGVSLVHSTKHILVDVAHTGRRALLLEKLRERGLSPADIEIVVLTHAHWDHMLNIDLFPNAQVLVSAAERRYAANPRPSDWATPAYTGAILERMKLHEVQEGDEIDRGVRILETPGHSPGSMIVTVDDEAGTIGITGDAAPTAASVLEGVPYLTFFDEQIARESMKKIRAHCRVLYPGHDRPFRLDGDRVTYLTGSSMRIWSQLEPTAGEITLTLAGAAGVTVQEPAPAR